MRGYNILLLVFHFIFILHIPCSMLIETASSKFIFSEKVFSFLSFFLWYERVY